jgi:PAS domain S-box-containing protein
MAVPTERRAVHLKKTHRRLTLNCFETVRPKIMGNNSPELCYSPRMTESNSGNIDTASKVFFRCVEDSNDAIMITNSKGALIYVNRAWQSIYGYSSHEAVGNTPRMLRSRYQAQDFYRDMWRQILDPAIGHWKGELINQAKDGREVPVYLTITPYRDENAKVEGYMGIALDMTQKKEMEAKIIQQDRLASVGLLSSGLAHEVGTPLGVIRGRAEYLMSQAGENDKLRAGLQVIVQQIDRISKLIYSLLHLARADRSEKAGPVIVSQAVQQVLNLTDQKLKAMGIELRMELGEYVRVLAESDKLTQVALNLIMNSIHAIESRAALQPACVKRITITAEEGENEWKILFQDTGLGISRENRLNLFKPFFTTKEVGSGTGLGLVISLQLVKSWGGNIEVDSREGEGTTMKVVLKRA